MGLELPYRALRPWLWARFGRAVHRVALDAGSSCPNRDGTLGRGGCFYCDVEGSGTGALRAGLDLSAQLAQGLARIARRDPLGGAIAYFQSYSNTYVEPQRLREVLGVVDPHIAPRGNVVAIALATRPDTLGEEALSILREHNTRVPVWLELGLETASDRVLAEINRLHTVADFEAAAARAHESGLAVIGHAILGLPGDGREGARRTAGVLARARVAGVKVHQLMVLRKTVLEHRWREGAVDTLELDEYVAWLADFVERLDPEQVLHRLTGDATAEQLLAPQWSLAKVGPNVVRGRLLRELERRGTRQGSLREALAPGPAAASGR
jgi:uncharacterized protein